MVVSTVLNVGALSVGGKLISNEAATASGITDSGTVTVGGNLLATTDANSGVINLGTSGGGWHREALYDQRNG